MSNFNPNTTEGPHQSERQTKPLEGSHTEYSHSHTEHDTSEHKEQQAERKQERDAATSEALEIAPSIEEVRHPRHEARPEQRHGPLTKKQLDQEFNRTMKYVQDEMSPAQRAFSRLIHNKTVEKTSELLGVTIARPNALLAGSIGAFTLTLAIYIFAKTAGYTLSGFEPIAAFLIGWTVGFLYDYFRIMITGKR